MPAKKFFLLDGSAIFYRSYFAFIRNPLINSKGENTSATFGFLNTVFKLIEDEKPDYLSVIFDTKEPTFRHDIYSEYKATREKMPEEMAETFPRLRQVLETINLSILEKPGFEADDIIATLARDYASDELEVYIISGDKDLAQLVSDHISIYVMAKSPNLPPEIFGRDQIKEKYGVYPEQITDWLALMGDKSDNVPGIPSVGEKTACALIDQFQSMDKIYENIDQISRAGLKQKIIDNKDLAYLSKDLVILDDKVKLSCELDDCRLNTWDRSALEVFLKDMEFNRLITRANNAHDIVSGASGEQKSEFSEKNINYHLINDEASFNNLITLWNNQDIFVFDLETDSLDTFTAKIAGIAISFKPGTAYYISLGHPDSNLGEEMVFSRIRSFFEEVKIQKSCSKYKI